MTNKTKGFGFFEILLTIAVLSIIASAFVPTLRQHVVQENITKTLNALDIFHVAMNQNYQQAGAYSVDGQCPVSLPAIDNFNFECSPKNGGRDFEVVAVSTGEHGFDGYQYGIDADGHRVTYSHPEAESPVDCWLTTDGACMS